MPAITPAKLSAIADSIAGPKRALLDALEDAADKVRVPGALLLVATYIPPSRSSGGIIIPDKSQDEALWQGCLGLVLKLGPLAFENDDLHRFHPDDKVKPGDWVLFRFSSAWEQHLNGVSVRFVADSEIKGRTEDPTIWTHRPSMALGG